MSCWSTELLLLSLRAPGQSTLAAHAEDAEISALASPRDWVRLQPIKKFMYNQKYVQISN